MKWRPIIIIALVAAAIWLAFDYGYDSGMANGLNQVNQANQELINQLKKEKKTITDKLAALDEKYTADMGTMQEKIDDAKKQAAQYEPPKIPDSTCDNLDDGWVRIHDAAASVSGVRNTKSTSLDDGKTGTDGNHQAGYSKKRAIEVITDNYSACAIYINRLEALQGFVKTLQKNNGEKPD